ncbi:MAG: OsmC family peroxiredoxin [Thermoleophilia bacterium]|nr:OsmC family peroxiredoxin [Thermoleophilia bacterium]
MAKDNTSTSRTIWKGDALTGSGHVSTSSPALTDTEVTWHARIGDTPGTTPEELLGAAHCSCYAMALNFALAEAGFQPDELDVTATVTFGPIEGGFAVKHITLDLSAQVPGIEDAEFQKFAEQAKTGCPISAALAGNVVIELKSRLAQVAR